MQGILWSINDVRGKGRVRESLGRECGRKPTESRAGVGAGAGRGGNRTADAGGRANNQASPSKRRDFTPTAATDHSQRQLPADQGEGGGLALGLSTISHLGLYVCSHLPECAPVTTGSHRVLQAAAHAPQPPRCRKGDGLQLTGMKREERGGKRPSPPPASQRFSDRLSRHALRAGRVGSGHRGCTESQKAVHQGRSAVQSRARGIESAATTRNLPAHRWKKTTRIRRRWLPPSARQGNGRSAQGLLKAPEHPKSEQPATVSMHAPHHSFCRLTSGTASGTAASSCALLSGTTAYLHTVQPPDFLLLQTHNQKCRSQCAQSTGHSTAQPLRCQEPMDAMHP